MNQEPVICVGSQFGSLAQPNPEEDSSAGDPVAFIVVIPHYAKLPTLVSEVDPARQLAESLALGKFRGTVLMGTVDSLEGYDTFTQLRGKINEFNSTVMQRKGRRYHDIELRSTPFQTLETLQEEIHFWMRQHFAKGQRTPFGLMASVKVPGSVWVRTRTEVSHVRLGAAETSRIPAWWSSISAA